MMFFIICMLGACTAEELAGPESGVEDDAPVVIAISPAGYYFCEHEQQGCRR